MKLNMALPWIGSSAALLFAALMVIPAAGCNQKAAVATAEGEETEAANEYERGPHGGRILRDGTFEAEITIYERGVPPRFRVYLYDGGKAVPSGNATLRIDLHRLGGRVDRIGFTPEQDYLVGDKVVEEPHSFDVDVLAARGGVTHSWNYTQVEGRVELSDEGARASGIQIETAGPEKMRSVLELPGEIALNGDRAAHIVPRLSGVIHEIRKNLGDAVSKGEVIAVIDSRELAEMKRQFLESSQQLEFSRKTLEREEGLWKKNISSEASYLEQERAFHEARLEHQSARQQLEALGLDRDALRALLDKPDSILTRYELRAPFDGVVIEKKFATGQAVEQHDDLFTVADLSTVWGDVIVYAKDLNGVEIGQTVTVTADSLGSRAPGRIIHVGSLVGAETRAAKARVVLQDPEHRWRPGLFVKVIVVLDEATVPVAVKRAGLQTVRDWDVVFVRVGDLFEARPLVLGRKDGEWVEVLSGLSPGEAYASTNSFILKADLGKSGASHDH